MQDSLTADTQTRTQGERTRFRVLGAISFSHFLNDMIQSLIIAIYPVLKGEFQLSWSARRVKPNTSGGTWELTPA